MKAPTQIATARLLLRKPEAEDAEEIFERYAGDATVCRFLAWPMHRSIDDTRAFLAFSDAEWERWPAGPYLILSKQAKLLGSTGLAFETPWRASTGYLLAQDAWGQGYATEALAAMQQTATQLGVQRLYAGCHPDHEPSRRVLEKAGFALEGTLRRYCELPNLSPGVGLDVVSYSWLPENKNR